MGESAGQDPESDPRVPMAAERTFLAWVRTAVALMATGFVVAKLGVGSGPGPSGSRAAAVALILGLGLIAGGAALCAISAVGHRRYVATLRPARKSAGAGSTLAIGVAALVLLAGVGMALILLAG